MIVHDRWVYLYGTCVILICIYWQMLYIVSVAFACDVSYLYTIHLFCSCIYILITLCYSCDVSYLNLFYLYLLFLFYLQKPPLLVTPVDRTCHWESILGMVVGGSSQFSCSTHMDETTAWISAQRDRHYRLSIDAREIVLIEKSTKNKTTLANKTTIS